MALYSQAPPDVKPNDAMAEGHNEEGCAAEVEGPCVPPLPRLHRLWSKC